MSGPDSVRLRVDIDHHLGAFHLQARFEIGTETLVLFGASGAGRCSATGAGGGGAGGAVGAAASVRCRPGQAS